MYMSLYILRAYFYIFKLHFKTQQYFGLVSFIENCWSWTKMWSNLLLNDSWSTVTINRICKCLTNALSPGDNFHFLCPLSNKEHFYKCHQIEATCGHAVITLLPLISWFHVVHIGEPNYHFCLTYLKHRKACVLLIKISNAQISVLHLQDWGRVYKG